MTIPLLTAIVLAGAPAGSAAPAKIHWERDFDQALKKAKEEQKPLFVDFWAPWCGWCHRLDETTYADPDVVRLSKDFIPVKVNAEGGRSETLVALRYSVSELPTIAFISPSGRAVLRLSGFQGPGQFPATMVAARDSAKEVFAWETAIDKDPKNSEALGKLGLYLFDQEAYEDSRDLLVQAVRYDQARPSEERKRVRMVLALIRQSEHRYPDAESLLKQAIALQPPGTNEAQLLYLLGRTYKAWGRMDRARPVLEEVVRTYPESPYAQRAEESLVSLERH